MRISAKITSALLAMALLLTAAVATAQSQYLLSPQTVLDRICRPGLILVDVRTPAEWQASEYKVFRAIRLEPEENLEKLVYRWDRRLSYVVYDAAPGQTRAAQVVEVLRGFGVQAFVLSGGWDAWFAGGLPIEGRQLFRRVPGQEPDTERFPYDRE